LCPDHRTPPEVQSEDNYFFRLSDFRETLLAAITDENHPNHFKIYPMQRRNEVIGKLKQEINDISISRATLTWESHCLGTLPDDLCLGRRAD